MSKVRISDSAARAISPRRVPSGASHSTTSGIWPSACVEQERHGSKQRMAASIRFSMPSPGCSPGESAAEMPRRLIDRHVHRLVVLPGGDQQVGLCHEAVLVHPITVEQGAARSFAGPNSLPALAKPGPGSSRRRGPRIAHQLFDPFDDVQHFDQARQMIMERLAHRARVPRCLNSRISLSARSVPAERATLSLASGPTR